MSQPPTYGPHNPHPLLMLRTELVWEGEYDEDGQCREVDISAMPIQKIYQRLNLTPEQIVLFCEQWQIAELAVFGSILRDDFRADGDDPSDIDFLYILDRGVSYGFKIVQMRDELAELVNRPVDLVSELAIQQSRNWLRRKTILESKRTIYPISPGEVWQAYEMLSSMNMMI